MGCIKYQDKRQLIVFSCLVFSLLGREIQDFSTTDKQLGFNLEGYACYGTNEHMIIGKMTFELLRGDCFVPCNDGFWEDGTS